MMRANGLHVIVAGAGGATGSAALHHQLADAHCARVTVLTTCRFLQVPSRLAYSVVADGASPEGLPEADHAVIVFGGARRAREMVYWQPTRGDLLPLATALRSCGVRRLEVVLADQQALHPAERQALAALAFEHVAETRTVPAPRPAAVGMPWPERLALWLIRTLIATLQMAQVAYRPRSAAASGVRQGRSRQP